MTLFILGAGSDMEYGFPSGEDLVTRIIFDSLPNIDTLYPDGDQSKKAQRIKHCEEFVAMLQQSDLPSIDSFLGENSPFMEIGKRAIFLQIAKAEQTAIVSKGLYHYLFQRISKVPNWTEHFAFITFNYDRSLEYYLSKTSLLQSHSSVLLGDDLERRIVGFSKNLKIVHVHGSLGRLDTVPYFGGTQEEVGPYLKRNSFTGFKVIAEAETSSLIDPDQMLNSQAKDPFTMTQYFKDAENVVFLGFGYENRNLKKLGVPACLSGKTCLGTIYGKTPAELNDIQAELKMTIGQNVSGMFDGRPEKCLDFLKQIEWL